MGLESMPLYVEQLQSSENSKKYFHNIDSLKVQLAMLEKY